jgi:hypothetical protein
MNDSWTIKDGPNPGQLPAPSTISSNTLYRNGLFVSPALTNSANNPSSGTIYYSKISGSIGSGNSNPSYAINGINSTTVHTPVVSHGFTSDDKAHDQRVYPTAARNTFVLDRPFSVTLSNHGTHVNLPGYGTQTYTKYIKRKEVLFPFDVYRISDSQYFPANTWIEIPAAQQSEVDFYLPVWVDEGNYTVYFRTIAENAPSDSNGQRHANTDISNHSAYDTVDVYVVGRLYDFRITDISDPVWDDVDKTYFVGTRGIDGASRSGVTANDTFPIRAGSHPTYKNAVPKHGYHIKFDVKTKGNMFGSEDGIRITPRLYFVPKTGSDGSTSTRIPVDLYYHDGKDKFIKVGSERDRKRMYVTLNAQNRNVSESDMQSTAPFFNLSYSDYQSDVANRQVHVGYYKWQILSKYLRTFIGMNPDTTTYGINTPPNATVEEQNRSLLSIQQWYGQYSLPGELYAVPAGTNIYNQGPLYEDSDVFLRNGYIVVNFIIESLQDGDADVPYLRYYNTPHANQWRIEGFDHTITDALGNDFAFHDGDAVLFDLDVSSSGDNGSSITH